MARYKAGDVLAFGDEWLIVLDDDEHPNVTINDGKIFLGGLNPVTDVRSTYQVLFNIMDIKRKVEHGT